MKSQHSNRHLRTANQIVEYLTPEGTPIEDEVVYSVIPISEELSMTEIAALVEKLSLNVEILPVGEDLFVELKET